MPNALIDQGGSRCAGCLPYMANAGCSFSDTVLVGLVMTCEPILFRLCPPLLERFGESRLRANSATFTDGVKKTVGLQRAAGAERASAGTQTARQDGTAAQVR